MMLSWKNLTIFEGNPKLSPTPVLLPVFQQIREL